MVAISKQDTARVKGLACLLLLHHHALYDPSYSGGLLDITAQAGKACVAMFLFVSGYGLSCRHGPHDSSVSFYFRRIKALYPAFWLCLIAYAAIGEGVLGLGRLRLDDPLGLAANVLGLQFFRGEYGVSPSWWFLSLILTLYAGFPVMKRWCAVSPAALLAASFVLTFGQFGPALQSCSFLLAWQFPFVLGLVIQETAVLRRAASFMLRWPTIVVALCGALGLWSMALALEHPAIAVPLYGLASLLMAIAMATSSVRQSIVGRWLAALGGVSYELYLTHYFAIIACSGFATRAPWLYYLQIGAASIILALLLASATRSLMARVARVAPSLA